MAPVIYSSSGGFALVCKDLLRLQKNFALALRAIVVAGMVLLGYTVTAHAENEACWGDDSREDITCTQITERLLLSLRGQTEDFVRKAMKAPGRGLDGGLHFISNFSRGEKSGDGDVNVTFEDGRTTNVSAAIDTLEGKHRDFIWSAYAVPALGSEIDRATKDLKRPPFCSDLSGKPITCSTDRGIDAELTKLQMQGNMKKADLLKALDASCDPGGGLTAADPAGDCPRLRNLMQ